MSKLKGKYGNEYNTKEKTIYGYDLKETPENNIGTMTEDTIVVNYVYKLKPTSVVVNYVDKNGRKLADKEKIVGKVFDKYVTTRKDIEGYELIKEPENSKGKMQEESIVVDYVYKQKPTNTYFEDENIEEINTGLNGNITDIIAIDTALVVLIFSLIFVSRKNKDE